MLREITNPADPSLIFIQSLYENSFPLHERRTWDALLKLLKEPAMHLQLIGQADQSVGFVNWWQLPGWIYVEHLAIEPKLRGREYGKKVMECITEKAAGKVLLETELPGNEDAVKRIRFYERLGFHSLPYSYFQPPYRPGEPPLPMQIMSSTVINKAEFELLTNLIRHEVYEKFY